MVSSAKISVNTGSVRGQPTPVVGMQLGEE